MGGSIFWKTPDIGLASYSIIPLRIGVSGQGVVEEGEVGAVDAGKGGGGA